MSSTVTIAVILLAIDSVFVIAVTFMQKWKLLAAGVALGALLDLFIIYSHNG